MTSPPQLPPWMLQQLQQALRSGDDSAAMSAATAAAQVAQNPPQSALIRMFDSFYSQSYPIADHIELKLQDPRQALPAGSLALKGTDPLSDIAITCSKTVVPIVYDRAGYRWSGRIDVAHDRFKDGTNVVECELIGDKHWLDRILCWPSPFLPVWIQFPAQWFGIGPGLTVIATLIQEQAFRIQRGLWQIVNDIGSLDFNFQGWIRELLAESHLTLSDILSVLYTPICVVPINPLTDTSVWIEINGRMDTLWKLIQQQLLDNGWDITATIWLPGEPQPPGLLFPLVKPTVVVQLHDRSGFTGPFGPFEGLAIDLVQLEGSLLGNALAPILGGNPQPYVNVDLGEFLAPALGVNFMTPTVILNLDVYPSPMIDFSVDHHHPLAWQVVVGGQSPKVCAPPGNRGGTDRGKLKVDQRLNKRHAGISDRRDHDRHRIDGPAK